MTDEGLYRVFEIAVVVLEIFTVYFYQSGCFLSNARPLSRRIFAYLLFGVVLAFFSVFYPNMFVLPFVTFAGVLCVSVLFYKGNILAHVSISALYLAIGIGIELLVLYTHSFVTGLDIMRLHDYGVERIVGATAAKLINLPVAKTFALFVGARNEPFAGRMLKTVPILICQFFLIFALIGGFFADYESTGEVTAFTLAETIGIIFVNIVLFLYFDKIVAAYEYGHLREMARLRSESQLKYYEAVKSNLDTLLRLDHETKRLTSVLRDLIDGGRYAEASRFLSSFNNSVKTALSSCSPLIYTDNPTVGAILCERVQKAETLGINPEIDVAVPSGALAIDDVDLTVILGNVLDNALEALELLPPCSDRTLRVTLRQSEYYLFCEVVNSFDPDRRKKVRRGYGLRNVEAVVDRCGGTFSRESDGSLFRVSVIINASSDSASQSG
jgi:hypothetical protein